MPLRHAPAVSLILSRRVPVWMVRQPITMPMVRTLGFGWIAQARVDPGDVEHVLANLTLPPLERLRRSMRRARLGRSAVAPDVTLQVLPIERVLVSKRAAGRLKDKAVIPALEAAIAAIKES